MTNFHEVANIFPLMDGELFKELCIDIASNGLIEPIWIWQNKIIDGRNRYRACAEVGVKPDYREWKGAEDGLLPFVLSLNLKRRHLTASQLSAVGVEVKRRLQKQNPQGNRNDLTGGKNSTSSKNRDEAGKLVGVSGKYIDEAEKIEKADPRRFQQVLAGSLTLQDAKSEIKVQAKKEKHAELIAIADKYEAKQYDGFSVNGVYLADIHTLKMPENSIDMIFTDPPYDENAIPLYSELARFASMALKPGAYLMTYAGKSFLPQVMNALGEYLEYVWLYGVFQPDSNHRMRKHHIFSTWRPIVCFKKPGKTANINWQPDMIKATRDKTFHEWQQQIEPPIKWIEAYTLPNDLVVDPFVGGGTTLAACKTIKRNYIGFDINPESVKMTKMRLEQE
jgi:hypothetical protein